MSVCVHISVRSPTVGSLDFCSVVSVRCLGRADIAPEPLPRRGLRRRGPPGKDDLDLLDVATIAEGEVAARSEPSPKAASKGGRRGGSQSGVAPPTKRRRTGILGLAAATMEERAWREVAAKHESPGKSEGASDTGAESPMGAENETEKMCAGCFRGCLSGACFFEAEARAQWAFPAYRGQ